VNTRTDKAAYRPRSTALVGFDQLDAPTVPSIEPLFYQQIARSEQMGRSLAIVGSAVLRAPAGIAERVLTQVRDLASFPSAGLTDIPWPRCGWHATMPS
jgi:hypothetical protein